MEEFISEIKAEDEGSGSGMTEGEETLIDLNTEEYPNNPDDGSAKIEIKSVKEEESVLPEGSYFTCDVCYKHYKTAQALRRHKTSHTSDKECKICGETFISKKVVDVHIRKVHLKKFIHNCSKCDYKSDVTQTFEIHLRTHTGEKPNKCDLCEKSYNDPSSLISHRKLVHTKQGIRYCETCGKGFLGQSKLDRHLITHARNGRKGLVEYTREFKSFAVKEAEEYGILETAKKHAIGHASLRKWIKLRKNPDTANSKFCELCGDQFSTQTQLDKHQITHARDDQDKPYYTNEFKLKAVLEAQQVGLLEAAKKLQVTYERLREWKRIAKNPKKGFSCCEICGKEFPSSKGTGDLKKHLLAHSKGKERPREYSTEFKEEVTNYAIEYGTPRTVEKFGISSSSIQKWLKIRKDPLPCSQCDEVFGYKHHLDQHIKSHHGEKKVKVNQDSFASYCHLNNTGELLLSDSEDTPSDDKIKEEVPDTDVTDDMEDAMADALHYLYPEVVNTDVAMEESDQGGHIHQEECDIIKTELTETQEKLMKS